MDERSLCTARDLHCISDYYFYHGGMVYREELNLDDCPLVVKSVPLF